MLTNADLMAIFNFTENDLAANRAGRVSARQTARLKSDSANTLGCGLVVLVGLVLIGVMGLLTNSSPQTNSDSNMIILILAVAVIMVIVVMFLAKAKTQSDVDKGVVTATNGKIILRMIPGKTGFSYLMQVNSKEFVVSDYIYGRLTDSHNADLHTMSFRVYFAPASNTVLSSEILSTRES